MSLREKQRHLAVADDVASDVANLEGWCPFRHGLCLTSEG